MQSRFIFKEMSIAYLGLGSNLGDKVLNLDMTIQQIALEAGALLGISTFYQTKPWGFDSENDFLNAVVMIDTEFTPLDLLVITQKIEKKIGRLKKTKNSYTDRLIDIDILLYDNQVVNLPQLTIPHKLLHKRDFVLIPMTELAPELIHPVLGKTMKELSEEIVSSTTVLKIEKPSDGGSD